jgi:hypothetical protein
MKGHCERSGSVAFVAGLFMIFHGSDGSIFQAAYELIYNIRPASA